MNVKRVKSVWGHWSMHKLEEEHSGCSGSGNRVREHSVMVFGRT